MKTLTSLERVLTTIRHQEPDVVPHFDSVYPNVREAILPGSSDADLVEYLDIDAIMLDEASGDKFEVVDESKELVRTKWGSIGCFGKGSETLPFLMEPSIKSEKDIKGYVPPDPDLSGSYKLLEYLVKRFKGKRAVIAHCRDPMYAVRDCMLGMPEYFKAIRTNPDLIERLNEISGDYTMRYLKNCIDVGADIVFETIDLAHNQGPFISPEDTEKFVMPNNRKLVQYVKSRGVPCLRHSDGNIWPLLDMIIDAGYDAIHPIDPLGGMDLGEVKAKYGDKICLMGNVDCTHLLSWGTTDEVREAVIKCIMQDA